MTRVKHEFPIAGKLLVLQAIKVACQSVEVLLAPLFIRMMMALGAIQPDAQKRLADGFCQILGCAHRAIEVDGAALSRVTRRREQPANPLVVAAIGRDLLPQPAMQFESSPRAEIL